MIDPAALARDALKLIGATATAGKPVLLVGDENARAVTLAALSAATGVVPMSLSGHLAQALIDAAGTRSDAATLVAGINPDASPLLLDRIHILMLPQLRTSALDVLTRVARRRPLCASWPGRLVDGRLRYADPDHPEFLDEDASRALVLNLSTNEGLQQ